MIYTNILKKISAVALLLCAALTMNAQDNQLGGEKLFIEPGGEAKVMITLANSDYVRGITGVIELPEGLSFVTAGEEEDGITPLKAVAVQNDRIDKGSQAIVAQNAGIKGTKRAALVFLGKIAAGEGPILSFDVKADEKFKGCPEITVSEIMVASTANEDLKIPAVGPDREVTFTATDTEVTAGDAFTLDINMENGFDCYGCACYFILPKGITLAEEESYLLGERTKGFNTKFFDKGNGKYLISLLPTLAGMKILKIEGTSGAIVTLNLVADKDFTEGIIQLMDGYAVNYDSELFYAKSNGCALAQPTGINGINADDDANGEMYNMSGVRVKNAKGIVIKRVNGKFVKTVVK